ncbi:MAG: ribonuclease H, partial [Bdellovibrionota bacterium]
MKNFILYSDGACSGNPGPGGWASIIYDPVSGIVTERGGGENPSTNNRMEITGVLEGLKAVSKALENEDQTGKSDRIEKLKSSPYKAAPKVGAQGTLLSATDVEVHEKAEKVVKVDVYTDSTYVIYGATQWMKGWKSRGWKNAKNEPVQNPDLWEQMD